MYEMAPTIQENNGLDFAMQFAKNHTIQLKIEAMGPQQILDLLLPENKQVVIEKTLERASKQEMVELFQLGRMNFKKEYKALTGVFPDIGKISRFGHFKIFWKRHIVTNVEEGNKNIDNALTNDVSMKQSEVKVQALSQKKEEGEQFFSVPEGCSPEEISNGVVVLQKEKRCLYKHIPSKWIKV